MECQLYKQIPVPGHDFDWKEQSLNYSFRTSAAVSYVKERITWIYSMEDGDYYCRPYDFKKALEVARGIYDSLISFRWEELFKRMEKDESLWLKFE